MFSLGRWTASLLQQYTRSPAWMVSTLDGTSPRGIMQKQLQSRFGVMFNSFTRYPIFKHSLLRLDGLDIQCQHSTNKQQSHCAKKPVTTMLTYPWKCTVLHCNHLGNTWKPLVLMTRHFDYCPSASEGDNQSVRSSAPVVSRCFPGGYNVKLYISRGRLAWWLLAFLHSECS